MRGGFSGWGNKPEGTNVLGLREKVENQSFERVTVSIELGVAGRHSEFF